MKGDLSWVVETGTREKEWIRRLYSRGKLEGMEMAGYGNEGEDRLTPRFLV